MSKKWSQFDPFTALAGDEEIVGLQGGTNKRGAVNGVFKTFFDDLYWPLGGAAELTGALSVDGAGNTLDFIDLGGFSVDVGLNNMAFTGSVLSLDATNSIVWNVDDGVDVTDIDIDPNSVTASTTDIHLNTTNSFNASADDGVDSGSLSLTPTGLDLQLASSVFTIEDNAGAVNALFLLYGSDSFYSMGSDDFVSADTAYLSLSNSSVPNNTSNIGFQKTTLEYFDLSFGLNGDTGLEQALFRDTRTIKRGIEYADSWDSDDWTEDTLTTKGYVDSVASGSGGVTLGLTSYTVAGVPSASPAGKLIYVSNESGGPQPAFSDGTDWRRITDGNIIAA